MFLAQAGSKIGFCRAGGRAGRVQGMPNLESLGDQQLAQIIEYLGEPTFKDPEHVVCSLFWGIHRLGWVSKRLADFIVFWADNVMDIAFHP